MNLFIVGQGGGGDGRRRRREKTAASCAPFRYDMMIIIMKLTIHTLSALWIWGQTIASECIAEKFGKHLEQYEMWRGGEREASSIIQCADQKQRLRQSLIYSG